MIRLTADYKPGFDVRRMIPLAWFGLTSALLLLIPLAAFLFVLPHTSGVHLDLGGVVMLGTGFSLLLAAALQLVTVVATHRRLSLAGWGLNLLVSFGLLAIPMLSGPPLSLDAARDRIGQLRADPGGTYPDLPEVRAGLISALDGMKQKRQTVFVVRVNIHGAGHPTLDIARSQLEAGLRQVLPRNVRLHTDGVDSGWLSLTGVVLPGEDTDAPPAVDGGTGETPRVRVQWSVHVSSGPIGGVATFESTPARALYAGSARREQDILLESAACEAVRRLLGGIGLPFPQVTLDFADARVVK